MRREYDFSKAVKNPYAEAKKSLISIRLDNATIQYFKELSTELGVPYQTLINSFLADCVTKKMRPSTSWQS
ncbi:MAG: BrnA antitoxin family protein [Parasutterella sp.]|uniref:BrnA antitoxin family protein n=1 Tax=Parasutterella sp. TaxID=2049037 RepID=UPI003999A01B